MSTETLIIFLLLMFSFSIFMALIFIHHFCKMSEDNKKQAEKVIGRNLDMVIIKGDARKLSELLEHGGVGVVSPPYENSPIAPQGAGTDQSFNKAYLEYKKTGNYEKFQEQLSKQNKEQGYSKVGVVSPPYIDSSRTGQMDLETVTELVKNFNKRHGKNRMSVERWLNTNSKHFLSTNSHNIGNLPDKPSKVGVVSPPYVNVMADQGHDPEKDKV